METRSVSLWKTLDWVTIGIYLLLIIGGWFSVCGASYDYGDRDFLDFSTRAGRQFVWIICSFGLGFILLMLEERMYDMFAYLVYIGLILLLIVTIFIAPDTKGSRSWLILGPVSLQPAEFAKFATALALAKFMNAYSFNIKKWSCFYSVADVADRVTERNRFGIGLSCFFLDAVSRRYARSCFVLRGMCSSIFCGRYSF